MGPRFCISDQCSWVAYAAGPLMSLRSKKSRPHFVQRSEMITMILSSCQSSSFISIIFKCHEFEIGDERFLADEEKN